MVVAIGLNTVNFYLVVINAKIVNRFRSQKLNLTICNTFYCFVLSIEFVSL